MVKGAGSQKPKSIEHEKKAQSLSHENKDCNWAMQRKKKKGGGVLVVLWVDLCIRSLFISSFSIYSKTAFGKKKNATAFIYLFFSLHNALSSFPHFCRKVAPAHAFVPTSFFHSFLFFFFCYHTHILKWIKLELERHEWNLTDRPTDRWVFFFLFLRDRWTSFPRAHTQIGVGVRAQVSSRPTIGVSLPPFLLLLLLLLLAILCLLFVITRTYSD